MAVTLKTGIYIVAAKHTPFAKMGREFKDVHPSELFAIAAREAFKSCRLSPKQIDTVNVGQVYTISGSSDGVLTPRHSGLRSGVPYDRPTLGVNRLCGSGFEAIVNSARDILFGPAQISLAGGTENMSAIPFLVRGSRFGTELGKNTEFEDYLRAGSVDSYCNFSMAQTSENLAQTSENLAQMYKLKRDQVDEYALKSQMKWYNCVEDDYTKKSIPAELRTSSVLGSFDDGAFEAEIVPVSVTVNGNQVLVDKDQHPRPNTTMDTLSQLPALFREGGVGTVGNSTGVNDGAGVLIVASEEAIKQQNLTPLVRLTAWSHAGVEPRIMGLGPVPAIRQLLKATNFTMDDIDMIEINEQFAAQALSNVIEMDLDQSKLNMNGGAIALGHPAAASGARIAAHLAHELRRRDLKRGIGATCIGGGQGIAVLFETV